MKAQLKLRASKEFVVGKHNIGWMNDNFISHFGKEEFEVIKGVPGFQKLPRSMSDAEIESELKPGMCTLGDILAFLGNPPEGTKDGYANLFYTPAFVVGVHWRGASWSVDTWRRSDDEWLSSGRVFSPATVRSKTKNSELESFVTRDEFEEFKKKVEAVIKI